MNEKKDNWDKLKILAGLIASLLVPIVIAFVGNEYSSALKESENRLRYTELAIEILNEPPVPTNKNIRGWAIDVVNKYSGVPINSKTKQEMLDSPILEVEKFVANEWAPLFIENFIKNPVIVKAWNEVLQSGNIDEQKQFLSLILKKVIEKTFEKRNEMINTVPAKVDGGIK